MKKWFSISVLALGLAASACGPTGGDSGSSDSCSSDSECKGDRICDDGSCVSPGGGDNGGGDNGGGGNGGGGSENNSGGGSENNGGGGGGGDDEYVAYCCIDGAFFGCDSVDDAEACVFEFGGEDRCTRDASYDVSYCDDSGGGDVNNDNNDNNDNGGGSDKKATGETCEANSECEGSVCLVRGSGDILGYCSNRCENFSDCPTFWDCEELENAAGRYCVED